MQMAQFAIAQKKRTIKAELNQREVPTKTPLLGSKPASLVPMDRIRLEETRKMA